MRIKYLRLGLITLLLVLLQGVAFNRLHLFSVATPYLFVYLIIKLPIGMSRFWVLLLSFLTGFLLDILTDTPGLNAGTLTLIAMLRPIAIAIFLPKDIQRSYVPSVKMTGTMPFWYYTAVIVAVHHIFLILAELFSFVDFKFMLLRIIFSTLLTLVLLALIELLTGEMLRSKHKPIR